MDRYAVLGNPVEHSRSPFIHARFAEATGQALHYGRVLAPLDAFADTVRRFAADGGRGCNVTVPFKFDACALAARRSARAALAGAANVLRFDADGWYGDNTDGIGLRLDIEHNAGVPLAGRTLLLAGAGGAAAGVLGPLIEARPARIEVLNRSADKANALVERHAAHARAHGVVVCVPAAPPATRFDVVINATSASLQGAAAPPLPAAAIGDGTLAVDLMYGAPAQAFLRWAEARGAVGRDGLGMLVEQAAEAFAVWRGVRPDTAPVRAALRAELAK